MVEKILVLKGFPKKTQTENTFQGDHAKFECRVIALERDVLEIFSKPAIFGFVVLSTMIKIIKIQHPTLPLNPYAAETMPIL